MIQGPIDILLSDTTVQSLVGQNKQGDTYKVYWVTAGEMEQPPYVVLFVTGNTPTGHKDFTSSLDNVSFAVFSYGNSPEQVDEIDRACRYALEVQKTTSGGYYFHRIYFVGQADGYDEARKLPYRQSTYNALVQRTET